MPLLIDKLRYLLPRLLFLDFIQKHGFLWPTIARFGLFVSIVGTRFVLFGGFVHTLHTEPTIILWGLGEVSCLLHAVDFYLLISTTLWLLLFIWIFSRVEREWSIAILLWIALPRNKLKILLLELLLNLLKHHFFSHHGSLLHILLHILLLIILLIREILMRRLLNMLRIRKSIIALIVLRLYIGHIQTHIEFLLGLLCLGEHSLNNRCIKIDLTPTWSTLYSMRACW